MLKLILQFIGRLCTLPGAKSPKIGDSYALADDNPFSNWDKVKVVDVSSGHVKYEGKIGGLTDSTSILLFNLKYKRIT